MKKKIVFKPVPMKLLKIKKVYKTPKQFVKLKLATLPMPLTTVVREPRKVLPIVKANKFEFKIKNDFLDNILNDMHTQTEE